MTDTVINSPNYYRKSIVFECIDFSELFTTLPAHAFEYVWRAGIKTGGVIDDLIDDLNKAKWYLNRGLADKVQLYDATQLDNNPFSTDTIAYLMARINDWRGGILYSIAKGNFHDAIDQIDDVIQRYQH